MSPTCPRSEVLCDIARCAADRLLSVGAGEVLPDLLDPGSFLPSVRPTRIFRQASRSGVVTNAHRINPGEYPQLRGLAEFFLFHADGADTAAGLTVDVVTLRNPARLGLDPRRDIQVLTPMHRGPAGAAALKTALQDAITPARADLPERRFGGRVLRVGDKVAQIRNNYDKGANGVFHGQGPVTAVDLDAAALTVRTEEDEDIDYDLTELDELDELDELVLAT